jgi:hypothetical protein
VIKRDCIVTQDYDRNHIEAAIMSIDSRKLREPENGAEAICTQLNKPVDPLAENTYSPDSLNLSRSELYKREVIDWQRARSVIEHENTLINHRVTWLLLSQAALLTAFGTIYTKFSDKGAGNNALLLLCFLSIFGSIICLNVFYHIKNAQEQLNRITKWWYRELYDIHTHSAYLKQKYDDINKKHPPLHFWPNLESKINCDRSPRIEKLLIRTQELPLWFLGLWAVVVAVILVS